MADTKFTRRRLLGAYALLPLMLVAAAAWASGRLGPGAATAAQIVRGGEARAGRAGGSPSLSPTPACPDDDAPTPAQTAGPFYTPNSPERTSLLEPGVVGTPIVVSGQVFSRGCRPVAGALLDFWQADGNGRYNNTGYRLRGHQFADAEGRYTLETVVPGLYPGRTRHVHVRVQAPNGPILTTQLYFPGEPRNATDGIFNPRLLMAVEDTDDGQRARFDFVLDLA